MNPLEKLDVRCIAAPLALPDKPSALQAVVEYAKKSPALAAVSKEQLLEGLHEREATGSTGFGGGIAIPHCRLAGVDEFVIGLIGVPDGVDFQALDGKPVRLLVFIIAPEHASDTHIRTLSAISRVVSIQGVVEEILAQHDPQAIRESILRHTMPQQERISKQKSMVVAMVQHEALFHDILKILAGIRGCSSTVMDAESIDAHLTRLPLFQGLWQQEPGGFSRVVLAVVDKRFVNELLYQIESCAGDLSQRDDVLIAVQELYYSAGSLGHIDM